MRILVISTFYPPVAFGGYEVECSGVVERLRAEHEVLVLTCDRRAADVAAEPGVRRELPYLTPDARGAVRAPAAAVRAARVARAALAFDPDLVYVWNGSEIPQTVIRVLADARVPIAARVCEHWFSRLFADDQFLRELIPADRPVARAAWAAACRAVNRWAGLRLDPTLPIPMAICWNSAAIARMAPAPPVVTTVYEEIVHSVPRWGDLYEKVAPEPAAGEIVFVGRVTPYKGVGTAIEALAHLRHGAVPEARLTVIGPEDGDHGAQLRTQAATLGVAGAITWRGPLSPEQTAAALGQAAALIVPSTWDEPFPLVTIEGALARVPVVASDVGGVSEGMRDEEHALLFARGDGEGAARALARVITEPAATRERIARAHAHAQQYRLEPYLERQAAFVTQARAVLRRPAR